MPYGIDAFGDQVGDVERLLDVADVLRHGGGVDEHFGTRRPVPGRRLRGTRRRQTTACSAVESSERISCCWCGG